MAAANTSNPKTSSIEQDTSQPSKDQRLIVWFTGVIALVTFFYAIFAGLQWRAMRQQIAELRRSVETGEQSAIAARDSADAAQRHANIAASVAGRQLRAYVHIAEASLTSKSEHPEVTLKIKNVGQTPAYNVRTTTTMAIQQYSPDVVFPDRVPGWQSDMTLASGATAALSVKRTLAIPAETIALLGTLEHTVYVFGEIRYKDVFEREQVTKFRLLYGGPSGVRGITLNYDTKGNEAT